jgi:hypothetical protein
MYRYFLKYFTLNSFIFLAKFAFGFRENVKFLQIMYKRSLRIFIKFEIFAHIEYGINFARTKVSAKVVNTISFLREDFLLVKTDNSCSLVSFYQRCGSGSGAFLTPGSGMGRKSASGSGIRNEQHGSYFLELRNHFFGLKYLNSLMRIRDPG